MNDKKRSVRVPLSFDHSVYVVGAEAAPTSDTPLCVGLSDDHKVEVLDDGLVVVRGALDEATQTWLAGVGMSRGHAPPPLGFYDEQRGYDGIIRRVPNSKPGAGRARVFDTIGAFSAGSRMAILCTKLVFAAQSASPVMPTMTPSHVMLVHYAHGTRVQPKIFWHKDDAPNDGRNDRPVVSVSLGESCDFRLCHGWSFRRHRELEASGKMHTLRLESGDAVLFGGPARYMHHTVQCVHAGTCPAHLLPILGHSRLNVTFRDAPDVDVEAHRHFRPPSAGKKPVPVPSGAATNGRPRPQTVVHANHQAAIIDFESSKRARI